MSEAGQAYEVEIEAVVRRKDGTIKSREWAKYAPGPDGGMVLVDQEVYDNGNNSE